MSKQLFVTLIVALLLTTNVSAESRLVLGGWSRHVPSSASITNETHNVVGVEHRNYSAGRFDNSFGRDTYYVARNWRGPVSLHWNWIASLGMSRGYRTCYGDDNSNTNFCPFGYVGVEYDKYRVIPTFKIVPGAVVFSPEIKF